MASGGGSHPSHLPITTASSTRSGSLQTPDASALFISSLGDNGKSNNNNNRNNFAPSPLDHAQSFTSLEELLTVTGISSSELDQSGSGGVRLRSRDRGGVDSMQRIAKEVESNQGVVCMTVTVTGVAGMLMGWIAYRIAKVGGDPDGLSSHQGMGTL